MKNLKASEISSAYVATFREYFNQYMTMRALRPYEEMQEFRKFMFQLGLLVDVWVTIEKNLKEKKHG